MPRYEYSVTPAPLKGLKAKGAKTPADRFARALSALINEKARDGWEYVRAETLPMQERKGLTGTTTVYQNLLVFRRPVSEAEASLMPPVAEAAPPLRAEPASPDTPQPLGPARLTAESRTSLRAPQPDEDR